MEDVFIRLINLPYSIKGMTRPDSNGNYNVYINSALSDKDRMDALKHELKHINLGHFFRELSICQIKLEMEGET